ncbi:hypothetical protein F4553_003831 [Allocatelliglobosispora scoriae]|uniref:Uncharacterized protein n=1 Tax=Allocatelliglobosispora scoriae TaxID=643052 RepID=A0A841BUN1_9ACTN|nr:hypothetical protein [Allocatelliglobosispora scoriae]MBB5870452.1 hypothetical protein [Allocatelliglobosispora scoriae]
MRRPLTASLLAVVLAATLTGGLAACAKKATPSASATADTALEPEETPSAEPSASASAAASPSAGAAPSASPSNPGGGTSTASPHSTKASKAGFVWSYNTNITYTPSTAYQFNSSGGGINVTYHSTGEYTVRFAGLGDPGGVAHVQAYGGTANYCTLSSWVKEGADEAVRVRCFNASGSLADSPFVANFAVGSQDASRFSYLWANDQSVSGSYKPSEAYRYDAVKSSDIAVKRTATGRYDVLLPAAGPTLSDPWHFQITAYGSAALCKLAAFNASARKAQVACRSAAGSSIDSKFALSFSSEGSFLGRADRRFGDYSNTSDGVANPSTGVYAVRAAELGQPKGQVVALARGTSSTYCHIRGWQATGADLEMTVVCFNPGGAPASSAFTVGVTW